MTSPATSDPAPRRDVQLVGASGCFDEDLVALATDAREL